MSKVPTHSNHALPLGSSAALRRSPRGPRSAVLLRVASDERLVDHVRDGSEAAFEAIYDRHHRGILAFCRHMLSSPEEAEDAVQHTFMSAYRHLRGATAEIQLRPWLYTIARNRCLSMLRARRERPLAEYEEPATDHLSAEAQRRSDVRELLADVARLPEDQRAALVLSELRAVSHDEIGAILGVPRDKVKALVYQARTSLAASRKARETPCEEIREQLANLRGGALRRTTLHRHLRECAGCRAFRDEVALQRRTLAIALPVIPSLGLKKAALGAAFGSGGAGGGGAAVTAGGGLAAKALVAVALVGGGTTATVEVTRDSTPAPVASAAVHQSPRATLAIAQRVTSSRSLLSAPLPEATRRGVALPAQPSPPMADAHRRSAAPVARHDGRGQGGSPATAEKPEHATAPQPPGLAKAKPVPPGQARKPAATAPGRQANPHAAVRPAARGGAKRRSGVKPALPGTPAVPPAQGATPPATPLGPPAVPPGLAKRPPGSELPPGVAKQP